MAFDDSDVEGNLPPPKLKIPSPAKCIDEDDECDFDGDAIVLCDQHYGERLANAERSAKNMGAAEERDRIVALLVAMASKEFMAGRDEVARTYRDLVTLIKKK